MDRAAKQAERERIAHQKALQRQAILSASADAAAEYEEIIEALTCAHRVSIEREDWAALSSEAPIAVPGRTRHAEEAALAQLEAYRPSWFARTFKQDQKARDALADAVSCARSQDDREFATRVQEVKMHNARIQRAKRVLQLDPDALIEALAEHSMLDELPFCVEGIDTIFLGDRVIAVVDGLDLEDMPHETVSLLKSGKASFKTLTQTKRVELHRAAICSAAVRVAIEYFSALPIEQVEVLMLADTLDRATGHIEPEPVLYLRTSIQALRLINLERAEAAALVERLGGHLDWNRKEGLRPINAAAFGIELS